MRGKTGYTITKPMSITDDKIITYDFLGDFYKQSNITNAV